MKPNQLSVRVDRATGNLWLTRERPGQRLVRIADITSHVLLALSAELTSEEHSIKLSRDVRFSDGHIIRITAEMITEEQFNGSPVSEPAA